MVEEPDEPKGSRPVLKPSNKGDFAAQVTTLPHCLSIFVTDKRVVAS